MSLLGAMRRCCSASGGRAYAATAIASRAQDAGVRVGASSAAVPRRRSMSNEVRSRGESAREDKGRQIKLMEAIRKRCSHKDGEGVRQAWIQAKESGLQPDVNSFGAAINAFGRCGMWEDGLALLVEMKQAGLTPNKFTYSMAIETARKGGQYKTILGLLVEMKEEGGLTPRAIDYTTSISAVADAAASVDEGGRQEGEGGGGGGAAPPLLCQTILDLVQQMTANGHTPIDMATYTLAIDACGKAGQWRKVLDVLDHMKANGTPPDVITYTLVLDYLGKAGQMKEALQLLKEMQEQRKALEEAGAKAELGKMQ